MKIGKCRELVRRLASEAAILHDAILSHFQWEWCQGREKSTAILTTAVPAQSPSVVSSKEDTDLSAAFSDSLSPLFRGKRQLAERTVMLSRTTNGAQ